MNKPICVMQNICDRHYFGGGGFLSATTLENVADAWKLSDRPG